MSRAPAADSLASDRQRVLALVERHGWNATAFQTLHVGYQYFWWGDDACVAYVDIGGAWVAAGAPIAAGSDLADTASAFVKAARTAHRRACFFAVEQRFVSATRDSLAAIEVAQQPSWDPREWPLILQQRARLREQLNRAQAKDVRVRQLSHEELEAGSMRAALERVIERWLATRGLAPMSFLVQIEPFAFAAQRRWFVAEVAGKPVAFAGLVPVPARSGWFVEDVLREPHAPNGTSELLIDAAMRWAAERGARWLTLGLAPLAGSMAPPLNWIRRYATALYDFGGLQRYKAKLGPNAWAPIYIAHPRSQTALRSIADSLSAFAGGDMLLFALRSILRGPPFMLRLLAALLIPWTLLLAFGPSLRWLEWPLVKWAWVIFDVLLAAALFRIARTPKARWVAWCACAVTADACLTALQAARWLALNDARASDWVVLTVGCTAPALASVVLWGAYARLKLVSAERDKVLRSGFAR